MEGALFLTPEKGRKRVPPQGATKITFKQEMNLFVLFPAGKSTKKRPAQGPIKITFQREIL